MNKPDLIDRYILADLVDANGNVHWKDIANVPTIEERKKGKWIIHETETDRYDDMKCPFCKKSYTVDAYRIDDIGFTAADFNFCPNCGASMTDKREGEKNRN